MREVNIRLLFKVLLITSILITLSFIFSNSLLPPAESAQQSTAVSGFLSAFIPSDSLIGSFILINVRKIAHFVEYGLLGIEVALYVHFYLQKKLKAGILSLAGAIIAATVDELLQFISGRGPAVLDVLIDVLGFITFSTLTYAALVLFERVKSANRIRMTTENNNG